jgi:phosphate-transporting ATPase
VAAVESLIAERISDGTSVIWSTHDNGQARRVASRILVITGDGGIEEDRP